MGKLKKKNLKWLQEQAPTPINLSQGLSREMPVKKTVRTMARRTMITRLI